MRIDSKIKMRLPCTRRTGPFQFPPVILTAAGIQSPDYAPTRLWHQIFGGWAAASHPALSLQHNLHYTQQGPWIPVATRMTGWGPRILTAARIMADNDKAMTRRNCSESMGERLIRGSSFVMPNQPEQSPPNCSNSPNNALTDIRPLPTCAAPIYHDARPSAKKPDHQPPGHRVLAQATISRNPPEINGIKWQQIALFTKKFVSGTAPLATKKG